MMEIFSFQFHNYSFSGVGQLRTNQSIDCNAPQCPQSLCPVPESKLIYEGRSLLASQCDSSKQSKPINGLMVSDILGKCDLSTCILFLAVAVRLREEANILFRRKLFNEGSLQCGE